MSNWETEWVWKKADGADEWQNLENLWDDELREMLSVRLDVEIQGYLGEKDEVLVVMRKKVREGLMRGFNGYYAWGNTACFLQAKSKSNALEEKDSHFRSRREAKEISISGCVPDCAVQSGERESMQPVASHRSSA